MKISIITVVLNDKENIEKTIQSVLSQKTNDLEYIIIDGGSTDGTLEFIKKYKSNIDLLISAKDNGIGDAFNKGLKSATGDIVGIINSGDWYEAHALNVVVSTFMKDNVDIVYGKVQYWKDGHKEYTHSADHTLLVQFMSMSHPAVFVKKSIYEKFGFFDENYKLAMDYELVLRFYMKRVSFQYVDKILANMSLGGMSDVHWREAYKEAYNIRKKYLGFSYKLYINYLLQVLKRYVSNLFSAYGLEYLKSYYRKYFSKIKKV